MKTFLGRVSGIYVAKQEESGGSMAILRKQHERKGATVLRLGADVGDKNLMY